MKRVTLEIINLDGDVDFKPMVPLHEALAHIELCINIPEMETHEINIRVENVRL